MSEENRKSRAWLGWVTVWLLLLAYPLSMGPVLKYGNLSSGIGRVYEPVGQFCEALRPLRAVKDWYTGLWGVEYDRDPKTNMRRITRWPD
jgi:hypothetical protein